MLASETQKDFVNYDDYWKYTIDKNLKEAQCRYEIELRQRHEKRRQNSAIQVIAVCALLCLAFSGIVVRCAEIYQAKYEIHVLQSEIHDLELDLEELGARIDNAASLNYVEKVALNDLKMQYPQENQIIYVMSNWDYTLDDRTEDLQMAAIEKIPAIESKLN